MSLSNLQSSQFLKQSGSAISTSLVDIAPVVSSSLINDMEKEQKYKSQNGSFKSKK